MMLPPGEHNGLHTYYSNTLPASQQLDQYKLQASRRGSSEKVGGWTLKAKSLERRLAPSAVDDDDDDDERMNINVA